VIFVVEEFWAVWDNIYESVVISVAMETALRNFGPYATMPIYECVFTTLDIAASPDIAQALCTHVTST
jgi:hypothetical protein